MVERLTVLIVDFRHGFRPVWVILASSLTEDSMVLVAVLSFTESAAPSPEVHEGGSELGAGEPVEAGNVIAELCVGVMECCHSHDGAVVAIDGVGVLLHPHVFESATREAVLWVWAGEHVDEFVDETETVGQVGEGAGHLAWLRH